MKPEYLNPKEHVYGGLFSAIIKHGFFHRLLQCMIITVLFACQPEWVKKGVKYDYSQMDDLTRDVHENTEAFLYQIQKSKEPFYIPVQTKIQSIRVDEQADYFEVEFTKPLSYIALREENVREFYTKFKEYLSRPYNKYKFTLKCLGYPLQELVPNFYRSDTARYDQQRIPDEQPETRIPVVSQVGQERYLKALTGMNIAVWPSHGWYYNYSIKRWEWQRPRFFQTVEDLLSVSFTTPYLIPMLENAGALVFTPRERDIQINEVVVDNDGSSDADCIYREWSKDLSNTWENDRQGFGFRPEPLTGNQNPFNFGTSRYILSDTVLSAGAEWIPVIPSTGYYSVYIAFNSRENSSDEVNYSVYHSGGKTTFKINQRIGGRTWIYLGTFKFRKGNHPDSGRVEITNAGKAAGQTISADAIRFGGGQGSVARAGQPSGRPRFTEAGKYWLQYAGFPDSLVHAVNGDSNDYVNDYKSRPEFANYLNGAPCGPNYDRENNGLGIPVDLALALHTDAGTNEQDDLIGTMVIYSIFDVDSQKVFPNGISRLANRDLADIVQTQIVSDVKNLYTYLWPRRLMKEAWYSEAARPNMPSVIIELLSHQNFTDTRLALDPLFRFNVSRAIYKGILKFLTNRYGRKYVVQPLPVDHLRAEIGADGSIYVNWQPVPDVLEPTAMPTSFQVFIRQDSGDFDNGHRVFTNNFILKDPKSDMVYNFRVQAENEGGLSLPSEIVSACIKSGSRGVVLVVNGFDRVSAPAVHDFDAYQGYNFPEDQGVPDHYDINFTGMQFDFNKKSSYRDNDAPGHGASYADFETKIIPGNTSDFIYVHGEAVKESGWSFASCSDEAVEKGLIALENYDMVDWILGEERYMPNADSMQVIGKTDQYKTITLVLRTIIAGYLNDGGKMFISGAYVGTDLNENKLPVDPDVLFSKKVLKMDWVTNHAVRQGEVFSADSSFLPVNCKMVFNTGYHPSVYTVEAPDAINPIHGSRTLLRYLENNFSAGIGYKGKYGLIVTGFPFETIISGLERIKFMKAVLNYLSF